MSDAQLTMKQIIALLAEGERLSVDQTHRAFDIMMSRRCHAVANRRAPYGAAPAWGNRR